MQLRLGQSWHGGQDPQLQPVIRGTWWGGWHSTKKRLVTPPVPERLRSLLSLTWSGQTKLANPLSAQVLIGPVPATFPAQLSQTHPSWAVALQC